MGLQNKPTFLLMEQTRMDELVLNSRIDLSAIVGIPKIIFHQENK